MSCLKKNFGIVSDIIEELKKIDLDGEAMQYILSKTGMEGQMLSQLIMTSPIEQIEYLIEERKSLGL
jgi:hypothetical protein